MLTLETREKYATLRDAAVFANADPQQTAVVFYSGRDQQIEAIDRAAFSQAAFRWQQCLIDLGVQQGDFVGIAHGQRPETLYAFWGALLAGAIPSLLAPLTEKLDPHIYFSRLEKLVDFAGAACLLVSDDLVDPLKTRLACPILSIKSLDGLTANYPQPPLDPDATAFLQHSSGTTGLQKGVALTHTAVLNQLAALSTALNLQPDEVIVSWLPLYHDMGLIAGFLLPLIQGVPLILLDPFEWARRPVTLLQAISDWQGTRCWLPNFAYNHLARRVRQRELDTIDLSSMRQFINCSEPVRAASHDRFLQKFSAVGATPEMLSVSYAMAENTFAVTQTPRGDIPNRDVIDGQGLQQARLAIPVKRAHHQAVQHVSCGRPIDHTAVKIVNPQGKNLKERQVGEIWVQSNCMLSGYFQRPDLQPIKEGWYQTGDMGYLAGGEVYVIGRQNDLIINAGKNIYPQDIEAIVNEITGLHPGRNVVFGVDDAKEGTQLIAVVAEIAAGGEISPTTTAGLKKEIRQRVAHQSMITVTYTEIVPPKWLIKTSSGKIARGANREKWLREKGLSSP
ncbi:MAG: AMP-binding protein [Ardenticatenaceae bacterium]|nr:AMP-binding protein [Ardenticatenaceae bacterium]